MFSILVVDDQKELRDQITCLLRSRGFEVEESVDGRDAAEKLKVKEFALVLCDVQMPNMSGIDLLKHIRQAEYSTVIALITAHGNVRDAVEAIQEGAFDYVEKPIDETKLMQMVEKAQRAYQMLEKLQYSAPVMSSGEGREFVGASRSMKNVFQMVERLTRVNTSVLIRGENGTGKELVARAIHFNSPRKEGPFVAVNCAAIPENLIESELFGHEKGAFTGADQRHIGKFQYAAKGTIFLDEIGDTSPATQVKLLRVLQEHTFMPVGSNREVKADVRVVAATNRDLEKMIKEGKFREDLYYRLNVMPILLPALRERKADIPMLVKHFMEKFNQEHGNRIKGICPEALQVFENYHWPGNIRELENAMEHAFVIETTHELTIFSLPEYIRKATRKVYEPKYERQASQSSLNFTGMDWDAGKEAFEREFIVQALKNSRGRINLASEQSNIPKNTLLRKIKKYNIIPKEYGASEEHIYE